MMYVWSLDKMGKKENRRINNWQHRNSIRSKPWKHFPKLDHFFLKSYADSP